MLEGVPVISTRFGCVYIYIYLCMMMNAAHATGSYNFISSFTFGDFVDVTYVLHGAREMGINGPTSWATCTANCLLYLSVSQHFVSSIYIYIMLLSSDNYVSLIISHF